MFIDRPLSPRGSIYSLPTQQEPNNDLMRCFFSDFSFHGVPPNLFLCVLWIWKRFYEPINLREMPRSPGRTRDPVSH